MCVKLIVSDLAARGRYVSREAYHVMRQLIDMHGWKHIETGELSSQPRLIRERIRERLGLRPDVVLFWEGYHLVASALGQIAESGYRVVMFCEDLHWFNEPTRMLKSIALSAPHLILASYAPVFHHFFPETAAKKRILWAPHSASPEFLIPLNRNSDNVILLSGMISRHYPLRMRLQSLAQTGELPIVSLPHPGYQCNHDHRTSPTVGAGYARRINQSRAAFTDASGFRYVLAKFFEIPAAGALLLGDEAVKPELAELGFREDVHYVSVGAATLESKLRSVVDPANHRRLDRIRFNGQRLVWKRHKTTDRARWIDRVCLSA